MTSLTLEVGSELICSPFDGGRLLAVLRQFKATGRRHAVSLRDRPAGAIPLASNSGWYLVAKISVNDGEHSQRPGLPKVPL